MAEKVTQSNKPHSFWKGGKTEKGILTGAIQRPFARFLDMWEKEVAQKQNDSVWA